MNNEPVSFYELNEDEKAQVIQALLNHCKLQIWREQTPDYTSITLEPRL